MWSESLTQRTLYSKLLKMFKLLICILGVVHAVPIPDSGEFKYGYYTHNTNYAVPSVKTVEVQHINLQPVDAVRNVQQAQPNLYATSFLKLDDDRYDFDDDDQHVFYSAVPQTMEVRNPTFSNIQAVQPITYNAASFYKVDDDDDRFDFDDNKHIFYSAFPQTTEVRKSTFSNLQPAQPTTYNAPTFSNLQPVQPTTYNAPTFSNLQPVQPTTYNARTVSNLQPIQPTVYNTPAYFKLDDDNDFDDDEHRFVYSAQPQQAVMTYAAQSQPSVMTYAAQPQPSVMTYAAQPQTALTYAFKKDFDDFDSSEVFRSVAPAYNGMFYSANVDRSGEFDDDNYAKTHVISKREVMAAPSQPQPMAYQVKYDSDNINSEEIFRSMVPSNVRATNYANFYNSDEGDMFDDDYSKASFLPKSEVMAAPAQLQPQVMTYGAQPQPMTYSVKHDFDDFNSEEVFGSTF